MENETQPEEVLLHWSKHENKIRVFFNKNNIVKKENPSVSFTIEPFSYPYKQKLIKFPSYMIYKNFLFYLFLYFYHMIFSSELNPL